MKNKLPYILVVIAIILSITAIYISLNPKGFSFNKTSEKETKEEKKIKDDKTNIIIDDKALEEKKNEIIEKAKSDVSKMLEENKKEEVTEPVKEEVIIKEETKQNVPLVEAKSENNVIDYFNNIDLSDVKDNLKEGFVNIIDFIFYDKEIKGYTFKELTDTAKNKIIAIAFKIDKKIDSYFPGYKDTIKEKTDSLKGKLALKYLEVTSSLCDKVGPDTCNQAKQDFNTMKKSFGFTFEFLKELATSCKNKVKDFYEKWRDE